MKTAPIKLEAGEVEALEEDDRVRCIQGKYAGWEGRVVEVHSKMITFLPCYRYDKKGKQRRLLKEHVTKIQNETSLTADAIVDAMADRLHGIGGGLITRSDWIEICDGLETMFLSVDEQRRRAGRT
jgi:hypothetical protein